MKKLPFRIFDFVIFAAILIFAFFVMKNRILQKGNSIFVEAEGKSYYYSAAVEGTFSVDGALGKTTFEIKNGAVHIVDSPCENKTCIAQGWSSPLVCLPNKVIITLKNQGEFDAVSE